LGFGIYYHTLCSSPQFFIFFLLQSWKELFTTFSPLFTYICYQLLFIDFNYHYLPRGRWNMENTINFTFEKLREHLPRGYAKQVVNILDDVSERTVYNVAWGITKNEKVTAELLKLISDKLALKKANEERMKEIYTLFN
jgi:hypothetical protein